VIAGRIELGNIEFNQISAQVLLSFGQVQSVKSKLPVKLPVLFEPLA